MSAHVRLPPLVTTKRANPAPSPVPLFRRAAIAAERHRCFGSVVVVTPPSAMLTLSVAMLAVACLVTSTLLIEIPERAGAVGVLLPANGLLKVRARRAGWVERLSVNNGSAVDKGQLLMWLSDGQQAPEREPESALRIASLRQELELVGASLAQDLRAAESRRRANQHRLQLIESEWRAAKDEAETRAARAAIEERRSRRVASLANASQVAQQTADDHAGRALAAKAETHAVRQRLLALQNAAATLRHELGDDAARPEALQTQAQMRRQTLQREIARSELQSALEVIAPDGGRVAGLAVRAGSYVQAGQVLLTLYDPGAPLEARLYVSAEDAGFISIGQRVQLRLRAYPHQLYGTLAASVTSVSGIAVSAREIDAAIDLSGPVFEIRATLRTENVAARGSVWQLAPGTSFEADLIRRRWPLYRWLLRSATDREIPRA